MMISSPNSLKQQEKMFSDSFDDISLPSHDDSMVASTFHHNDISMINPLTVQSSPNSPRPRSTSFTPQTKKGDLESAFLYKTPFLSKPETPKFSHFALAAERVRKNNEAANKKEQFFNSVILLSQTAEDTTKDQGNAG